MKTIRTMPKIVWLFICLLALYCVMVAIGQLELLKMILVALILVAIALVIRLQIAKGEDNED